MRYRENKSISNSMKSRERRKEILRLTTRHDDCCQLTCENDIKSKEFKEKYIEKININMRILPCSEKLIYRENKRG